MSKLVTSDNLKAYHAELAEHIKLLQRNTAYVLDDIVNYDGITLKCTTAGTTNTTKPNISSLSLGSTYTDGTCVWTRVDLDKRGIDYYVASKDYEVDDQVVYNNKIYKCITAHTSTSTFDTTKWTEISAGGGGGISVWQANTSYSVNDIVIDSNLIWQCVTAHTSTTIFDETKWICLSGGEISNGYEIVPLWEGNYNSTGTSTAQQLADSVVKYEYLLITFNGRQESGWENKQTFICKVSDITEFNTPLFRFAVYAENNAYTSISIGFTDYTHFYNHYFGSTSWSIPNITSVQGIRKAKPIVSSGMKYETLWEGEAGNLSSSGSGNITLSEPYTKYKKLGFCLTVNSSGFPREIYRELDTAQFADFVSNATANSTYSFCWGYSSTSDYFDLQYTSTLTQIDFIYNVTKVTKIIGISEGVQIPTGVQAARVELWSGSLNTVNSSQTLSDSIENYDQFEVTFSLVSSGKGGSAFTCIYDTSSIGGSTYQFWGSNIVSSSGSYVSINFSFSDSNHFYCDAINGGAWGNVYVTKLTGIKYIQPDSYSTEEKLIGTWIDGKPLYRKVFENVTSGFNSGISSTNYNVVKIYGKVFDPSVNNDNTFMIPYADGTYSVGCYLTKSTGIVTVTARSSGNVVNVNIDWVAVEYTKN